MSITVAALIYKSPTWLEWMLRNLAAARNDTEYRVLVVGNDANSRIGEWIMAQEPMTSGGRWECEFEVKPGLFLAFQFVDHRNADPYEYNMARVYRAWARAVQESRTDDVVLVNSDMAFADHWLDELVAIKAAQPKCLPTSLLVESGRLVSGLPDYVKNFGTTPATFQREAFMAHADAINRRGASMLGGLFQPVLFNRQQFLTMGGYPIQEKDHVLASDAVLFNAMAVQFGLEHRTAMGSVVYHCQEGEQRDE